MPVEIRGQQIRIRVKSPKGATMFRTQDMGARGKLQRVAGLYHGKWHTQSWRINLLDYASYNQALVELDGLYKHKQIPLAKYRKAKTLLKKWFVI